MDIQSIAGLLQASLDPAQNRQGMYYLTPNLRLHQR